MTAPKLLDLTLDTPSPTFRWIPLS